MARIETYGNDNKITGFDKVIGTDVDSGRMTKNYLMRDIREYIFDGASPEVGGKLKITNVAQDIPIPGTETPEALLNNLDPILEVSKYEVLVVSLAFNDSNNEGVLTNNVYLFNKTDIVVGFQQYESTSADFILLSSKTDNSNLVESVGNGDIEVYKGFDTIDNKHQIRNIKSDTLLITIDGDAIKIEAEEVDLGGVRNFYVNNKYQGGEELGTIAKPYSSLDGAISSFIGNGSVGNPQSLGSTIVVQASNVTENFTSELSIYGLRMEVQEGATIEYKGDSDYMVDIRTIIADPEYNGGGFSVDFFGDGNFYSDKGLIYAKGSGTDGTSAFERYSIRIFGESNWSSYYRLDANDPDITTIPVTKGTNTPVISRQGSDSLFFNGNVMELPAIVCDGDNGIAINITVYAKASFRTSTQVLIHVKNNGYFDISLSSGVIFGYSQGNIGHYGGLDGSVQNGDPNVLLPNEYFNFIRLDSGNIRLKDFVTSTAGTATRIKNLFKVSENLTSTPSNLNIQSGEFLSNNQVDTLISLEEVTNYTHTFINLFVNPANPRNFSIEYTGSGTLTNAIINDCNIYYVSDNIDFTKGNSVSAVNRISGRQVENLKKYTSRVSAESDSFNAIGTKFLNTNGGDADTATWFIDITMQ